MWHMIGKAVNRQGMKPIKSPSGLLTFPNYDSSGRPMHSISAFFSSDGIIPDNGDFSDWPKYKVTPVSDAKHHGFWLVRV